MEITSSILSVRLKTSEGLELKRFEYPNREVDWEIGGRTKHWKLVKGSWFVYNQDDENYELLTDNIPTWEKEYQELLLTQYPFEKRVREIISTISEDAEHRVNHIMCQIADDVAFEGLIEEYIK